MKTAQEARLKELTIELQALIQEQVQISETAPVLQFDKMSDAIVLRICSKRMAKENLIREMSETSDGVLSYYTELLARLESLVVLPEHKQFLSMLKQIPFPICASCAAPGADYACSACDETRYCNANCQARDWAIDHRFSKCGGDGKK